VRYNDRLKQPAIAVTVLEFHSCCGLKTAVSRMQRLIFCDHHKH
jgi:hypothetical protein